MNSYIFSPSMNSFYPIKMKAAYESAGSWPTDGIEVDDGVFYEFTSNTPAGKIRIVGDGGLPAWGDIPPPTPAELIALAESEKIILIAQANDYMNGKQWPGKAAMGRLSDAEKSQYNAWLDYLDALEALDTSSAPDINWPSPPEV